MSGIFKKKINLDLIKIIISGSLLMISILAYFYFAEKETKLNALIGGLLAGLIVGLFQLLLSWHEYKSIDRIKRMRVKDIRSNRANRDFYETLIRNATTKIDIMGVTADRFMNDFADSNSNQENMRVLFAAMSRGVKVRILLPEADFLDLDTQKRDAATVQEKMRIVKSQYQQQFEYKYFKHLPTHSIFVVDETCILGPVFPGIQSKDTPAIYLESESPYAEHYLKYYEQQWIKH